MTICMETVSHDDHLRIIILGMGGEVSKGILKAIRQADLPCEIIGACISPDSDGLYVCDRAYLAPYANDLAFIDWLAALCRREAADIVLTGVEENIRAISENMTRLRRETSAVFRFSSPEQLRIGGDKYETCRWLEANGFPHPHYALPEEPAAVRALLDTVGYDLIAKPRDGKGSRGVFRVNGPETLRQAQSLSGYVLEEYVGTDAQEYTVGCYYGLHGELPEPIIMRRELKNGSTWKAEVVRNEAICRSACEICRKFAPDGPLNIQLRLNAEGVPVPFELNVRFSGTTPMRAHFGFCDVKAMLYESLLHQDIAGCFAIREGKAFRYTEEVYLDGPVSQTPEGRLIWE